MQGLAHQLFGEAILWTRRTLPNIRFVPGLSDSRIPDSRITGLPDPLMFGFFPFQPVHSFIYNYFHPTTFPVSFMLAL